jgi:chromate reductase
MNIVAISGSLRAASLNTALLQAAAALAPEGVAVRLVSLRDVPFYDADLPDHPGVAALREHIHAADAVLIATPEYNYSVPGVLKNALDWASRPAYQSPLAGKPIGVMSASPGVIGGARAQQHLKVILLAALAQVYPAPELCVGGPGRFEGGALVDPTTRDLLSAYMLNFQRWVTKVR